MMGRTAELLAIAGLALLVIALAGCPGRVHDRPQETAQEALEDARWCVYAKVGRHPLVACTQEYEVCAAWRKMAREKGRWIGVVSMSSCEPATHGR